MTSLELFSLLGGVGLFLYGMSIMSTGLRNACGEKLKTILEHATRNKCISVLVGIAVTILVPRKKKRRKRTLPSFTAFISAW